MPFLLLKALLLLVGTKRQSLNEHSLYLIKQKVLKVHWLSFSRINWGLKKVAITTPPPLNLSKLNYLKFGSDESIYGSVWLSILFSQLLVHLQAGLLGTGNIVWITLYSISFLVNHNLFALIGFQIKRLLKDRMVGPDWRSATWLSIFWQWLSGKGSSISKIIV